MPMYNFNCPKCNNTEEKLVKSSDPTVKCSMCESNMNKMVSAPNIVHNINFNSKVPSGFKDKLREIKKVGGKGSKIDV